MDDSIYRQKKEQEKFNKKSILKMQNKQSGKEWAILIQHVSSLLSVKGT